MPDDRFAPEMAWTTASELLDKAEAAALPLKLEF
jgi:hypothetical protein